MHYRIPIKQATDGTNPRGGETSTTDLPIKLENALRELTGRLINVQDQERTRIARDLHDSMGQMVALLKMNLDRIAKSTPEPSELIVESVALVGSLSTQLRTISYLLHPAFVWIRSVWCRRSGAWQKASRSVAELKQPCKLTINSGGYPAN